MIEKDPDGSVKWTDPVQDLCPKKADPDLQHWQQQDTKNGAKKLFILLSLLAY